MVLPLVSFESLHGILGKLYEDMMPLCGDMTSVASAIAGLGAMLYICYRVWKALASAEPIDLFPLLRPFALGICIVFFQSLVLGGINGILSPIVKGTNRILTGQTFNMSEHQAAKDELERQNLARNPETAYLVSDGEFDRQIAELGLSPNDVHTMEVMYEERFSFGLRSLIVEGFRWILEILFQTASLVIDTIRTFYLVVLSILGPIAFALSVFDGFQATLTQWLCKYITVYLWLPVSDLFGAVLSRLQVLSLQRDMELMAADPLYFFDANNAVYLVFMIIGICGYFTVPSVASWIVQAGGFGSYNRLVTRAGSVVGHYVAGAAGALAGNIWGRTKEIFSGKNDPQNTSGGGSGGGSVGGAVGSRSSGGNNNNMNQRR